MFLFIYKKSEIIKKIIKNFREKIPIVKYKIKKDNDFDAHVSDTLKIKFFYFILSAFT